MKDQRSENGIPSVSKTDTLNEHLIYIYMSCITKMQVTGVKTIIKQMLHINKSVRVSIYSKSPNYKR